MSELQSLLNHAFEGFNVVYVTKEEPVVIDPFDARRRLINCVNPIFSSTSRICGERTLIESKIPSEYTSKLGPFEIFTDSSLTELCELHMGQRIRTQNHVFKPAVTTKEKSKRGSRKPNKSLEEYFTQRFADAESQGKLLDVSLMKITDTGAAIQTKLIEPPSEKARKVRFQAVQFPQLFAGYVPDTEISKKQQIFDNFMFVINLFADRSQITDYDFIVQKALAQGIRIPAE